MLKRGYILLAAIVMVLMGVIDFLLKKAIEAGVNFYSLIFLLQLVAAILIGFFCIQKKYPLKINKAVLMYSAGIGLLLFIGTVLFLLALKSGSASVITPITRMGFVVTAVCAFIFLKEKITLNKGLGILCAVASLILLSLD